MERAIKPRIARRRAEEERAEAFSSASDDEVGGLQSAIRSERSEQSKLREQLQTRLSQ